MPGIAQRRTKLSGRWYDKGEAVPDELVTGRNIASGLIVRSASSGLSDATDAEVWAEALARGLVQGDDPALAPSGQFLPNEGFGVVADLDARAGAGRADGEWTPTPFDPSEHKVDEVLAHVDANPDDLDRITDAELAGKARKTLLDELDHRQAEAHVGEGEGDDGSDDPGGTTGDE